jgi:predicted PurR-regulated permease PerM
MMTFALLFTILFFYGIILAKGFLAPLILGTIFSYLVLPFTTFLEDKARFPRILANLVGIFSLMGFFTLVFFILYKRIGIITQDMPELVAQAHHNIDHMGKFIEKTFGITIASQNSMIHQSISKLTDLSGNFGKSLFKGTTSTLFTLGLIPVFMFYMLFYREKFRQFAVMITPKGKEEDTRSIIKKISRVTPRYVGGVFTVVLILSVLNSFGLWVVGVEYAILFGIISAMFSLIPYFGTWIGASIPFTFALLTGNSPHLAVGVLILFVIIQFTENNILTPNITGSYVNLNPFITIVLIILGGAVWGIIGMFVVVPIVAMLKIFFDHSDSLKPIAFLIGADAENRKKAVWRKKFLIKSTHWIKKG